MFKQLRLRLFLLYFLSALITVIGLGAGADFLLRSTLNRAVDLNLRYRMAQEFHALGLDLPPTLREAETSWAHDRGNIGQQNETPSTGADGAQVSGGILSEANGAKALDQVRLADETTNGLADIFILPLNKSGQLSFDPNPAGVPLEPDLTAVQAAQKSGSDLRTVDLPDGSRARLLTYALSGSEFAYLQIGRRTGEQDAILAQSRMALILFGSLAGVLWLAAAWWLSGRSIAPAQHAWEQQRTFIANASHELRTPLTLIRASVEIAQRQTINLQHRTLLADVLADCDYMNRLVEDLLTLSRLDNQRLILNPEPVQLSRFLPEIGAQVDKLAVRKEVFFSVEPGDAIVKVDPARLKQILLILLDNAFRYTPAGGSVLLSAEVVEERVNISVSDSGVGIAPEHLPHVFERFYKLDPPQDEEYRGSGLGLSIAKSLVEAQGGDIRLDSEVGKGTRAMITFRKEKEYAAI